MPSTPYSSIYVAHGHLARRSNCSSDKQSTHKLRPQARKGYHCWLPSLPFNALQHLIRSEVSHAYWGQAWLSKVVNVQLYLLMHQLSSCIAST